MTDAQTPEPCHAPAGRTVRVAGRPVRPCSGCGAMLVEGPATPPTTYDRDYFRDHYAPRAEAQRAYFLTQLERLEGVVQGRRVLDVGCGSGAFVRAAVERGWDATGVDPSSDAIEAARASGPDGAFLHGEAGDLRVEQAGPFDLVTFWDSLAHMPPEHHPLQAARALLREGGVLVVRTPNRPAVVLRRVARLPVPRSEKVALSHVETQCVHFDAESLTRYLERGGFVCRFVEDAAEVSCPVQPGPLRARTVSGVRRALRRWVYRGTGDASIVAVAVKEGP